MNINIYRKNGILNITSGGRRGAQGEAGKGVPTGGDTGQVLSKKTDTDFDTEWRDDGLSQKVNKTGDTMTGELVLDFTTKNYTLAIEETSDWKTSVSANQGLATDGTYMYVASSHNNLEKYLLSDGSLVDSLVASNKIGGLYLYNGKLYSAAGRFAPPYAASVSRIDPDTMTLEQTIDLTANTSYGLDAIVIVDDIMYVGETAASYPGDKSWYSFTLEGEYIAKLYTASTQGGTNDWQDAIYYDGYIIATDHAYNIAVFSGVGTNKLTKITTLYSVGHLEGIAHDGNDFYIYNSVRSTISKATLTLSSVDSKENTLKLSSRDISISNQDNQTAFISGNKPSLLKSLGLNGLANRETLRVVQLDDGPGLGFNLSNTSKSAVLRIWVDGTDIVRINNGAGGNGHIVFNNNGNGRVGRNGIYEVVGTGFPNSVVAAPVGSKYIDKNATDGIIEWVKATGSGNTGWVISVRNTDVVAKTAVSTTIIHGSDKTLPRPAGFANVTWIGSQRPDNAILNDIFIKTV